jgi:hypothetical protein
VTAAAAVLNVPTSTVAVKLPEGPPEKVAVYASRWRHRAGVLLKNAEAIHLPTQAYLQDADQR